MNKKILIFLVALVFGNAYSAPEIKGNPDELRQYLHADTSLTTTITGRGKEKAYSDKAIVTLVVTTEDPKLAVSLERNTELRGKISKTMIAGGIKAENIKTSKFSTSPQYGWFGKRPDSYKVINRMVITIFSESHMQELARIADENKEIEFGRTAFEHSEKEAFRAKVKKQALEDAIRQKQYYENSLGVKLVPVNFTDNEVHVYAGADNVEEEVVVMGIRSGLGSTPKYKAPEPSVSPTFDEIEYQASISVDYKVVAPKSPN